MNSSILKRVLVAFAVCLLLVLLIHQRVEAVELSELAPFPPVEKNVETPSCENAKNLIANYSQKLIQSRDNLTQYLGSAGELYHSWYTNLQPYEGQLVEWSAGQFSPLKKSSERLTEFRETLYFFMDDTGEFLSSIVDVLAEPTCIADSSEKDALLMQFENFSMIHSEHVGTTADFISRMRSRLENAAEVWVATETQIPTEPLANGYFSLLRGDAEIFSNSARVVQNNANYVHSQFEELSALLESLLLPLAPRP